MWDVLLYFSKLSLISAILYSYYLLTMRNSNAHQWNRYYLMAIVIVSLVIPFIQLPGSLPGIQTLSNYKTIQAYTQEKIAYPATEDQNNYQSYSYQRLAVMLYYAVSLFFLSSFLFSFIRMYNIWLVNHREKRGDVTLISSQAKGTPFSFFHLIFWNEKISTDSIAGKQILAHEMAHAKQRHSIDRLFINMVIIVAWVNPVYWFIRKELLTIHEFLADKEAVQNGQTENLARLLLTTAFPNQMNYISSHFFASSIKRRITMITQQQKKRFSFASRLLLLPFTWLLVMAFAEKDLKNDTSVPPQLHGIQDTVEAKFPGGNSEKGRYFNRQIHANLSSIQSAGSTDSRQSVIKIQFTVNETGHLTDFVTLQNDAPNLANLITQFLKEGPVWSPMKINGDAVPSTHQVSLKMLLEGKITTFDISF